MRIHEDFDAEVSFHDPMFLRERGLDQDSLLVARYRPEFFYEDEWDRGWMIWPTEFRHLDGSPLDATEDPPKVVLAKMVILDRSLVSYHKERMSPGTRFRLCHAGKEAATGVIIRVLDD